MMAQAEEARAEENRIEELADPTPADAEAGEEGALASAEEPEFILKDSFSEETEEESLFGSSEMASDEDILNAEKELEVGEGHV